MGGVVIILVTVSRGRRENGSESCAEVCVRLFKNALSRSVACARVCIRLRARCRPQVLTSFADVAYSYMQSDAIIYLALLQYGIIGCIISLNMADVDMKCLLQDT